MSLLLMPLATLMAANVMPPPPQSSGAASPPRWPVFFERLGQVHSVHNRFDLRLRVRIDLPSLQRDLDSILHRLELLDSEFRDPDQPAPGGRRKKKPSRLDELNHSWRQQNRHLRERAENQRRRAKDLRQLGMHYPGEEAPEGRLGGPLLSRRRRQGILKGFFGVAYNQDVEDVQRRLNTIDTKLSSSVNAVRSRTDLLSSSTKAEMNRQTKEIKEVEDMATKLERKVGTLPEHAFLFGLAFARTPT